MGASFRAATTVCAAFSSTRATCVRTVCAPLRREALSVFSMKSRTFCVSSGFARTSKALRAALASSASPASMAKTGALCAIALREARTSAKAILPCFVAFGSAAAAVAAKESACCQLRADFRTLMSSLSVAAASFATSSLIPLSTPKAVMDSAAAARTSALALPSDSVTKGRAAGSAALPSMRTMAAATSGLAVLAASIAFGVTMALGCPSKSFIMASRRTKSPFAAAASSLSTMASGPCASRRAVREASPGCAS